MLIPAERRSAADACPGALRLHAAADGLLARVRLPGGLLSGAQLRTVRELAEEFGDGQVELTSRANLQLRGLGPGPAEVVAARLAEVGLLPSATHELVRNITASPLVAWERADEIRALDRALCADPRLAALPGRFLFALDGGALDVARSADVAAVVLPGEPAERVAILFAGVDAGLRVAPGRVAEALLVSAHAFLDERDRQGRDRHGHDRHGHDRHGHDRHGHDRHGHDRHGHDRHGRGDDGGGDDGRGAEPVAWRVRELIDGPAVVAGRAAAALGLPLGGGGVVPEPVRREPVGLIGRPGGVVALGAVVPLGRVSGVQMKALEQAAVIVVTPWRGVVLPGLPPSAARAWQRELAGVGLEVEGGSRWSGVTACAGRPGCAKALADVRRDATTAVLAGPSQQATAGVLAGPGKGATAGVLAGPGDQATAAVLAGPGEQATAAVLAGPGEGAAETLAVHWVGCARGCGSPPGRHVRVEATGAGYEVRTGSFSGAAAADEVGALVAAARRS